MVNIDGKLLKKMQKYAISAYLDENKNGKLDYSFYGAPIEKYGSSNNVRPTFSAPSFKDSSFLGNTIKLSIVVK